MAFLGRELEIFMRPDADESVMAEIFRWREYKAAEEIIRSARLPILDVGAHIGIFSLYAKALNPLAEIFALEPEKDNFDLMAKNLRANGLGDVRSFKLALAGADGERELLVAPDSINHHLLAMDVSSEAERGGVEKVSAQTLGGFLKRNRIAAVGLLKMDVEGGEYEIFSQLRTEDFLRIHSIIMEYHDDDRRNHREIEKLLRLQGFSVQTFPSRFESDLGFLLARNKRAER